MNIFEISIRLLLITLFSGIIGYERERNQSHAGLKTHMIVGISATIIALIQQSIMNETLQYSIMFPEFAGVIKSDPARLIAQVVSGIGFLGGGTIIVTKRNVSGLTTAASIWSVAGLGLSLGMGYYEVAVIGFIFITLILILTKKLQSRWFSQRIRIEYVGGHKTIHEIVELFKGMGLSALHLNYSIKMYGDERVYSSTFDIEGPTPIEFHEIINTMVHSKSIISVQATNLE
nr:putative MgtC/SapB transporter [uncultured bacterium]